MSVTPYTPSSSQIVHEARVDFRQRVIQSMIHIVQYDKSLPIIAVELYSNGQKWVLPSEADVKVRWGKRDHTYVYLNVLGCNADRTIVYFEIVEQMTVFYGEHNPVLEVIIGQSVACSSYIPFYIDRNPIQRGDIESEVVPSVVEMLEAEIRSKQDILQSGTNIKTINGQSILGSGDLVVSGGFDPSTIPSGTIAADSIVGLNSLGALVKGNLDGKYVKIIAPPSSTTLTESELEDFKGGVFINGDFINIHNPTFLPLSNAKYGLVVSGRDIRAYSVDDANVVHDNYRILWLNNYNAGLYDLIIGSLTRDTQLTCGRYLYIQYGNTYNKNIKMPVRGLDATPRVLVATYTGSGGESLSDWVPFINNLAPEYDATQPYALGALCVHDGTLYQCSTAIATAEAWNAAHWTRVYVSGQLSGKQDTLVSGTNIKTINNQSILGSGDITISTDLSNYYTKTETDTLLNAKQNTLVSGTTIKTIDGYEVLGSGDINLRYCRQVDSGFYKDAYFYLPNEWEAWLTAEPVPTKYWDEFLNALGITTTATSIFVYVAYGDPFANNLYHTRAYMVTKTTGTYNNRARGILYTEFKMYYDTDGVYTWSTYNTMRGTAIYSSDASPLIKIAGIETPDLTNYYTKTEVDTLLGNKQATLVSGTNIKTVNGYSLLGSGNIDAVKKVVLYSGACGNSVLLDGNYTPANDFDILLVFLQYNGSDTQQSHCVIDASWMNNMNNSYNYNIHENVVKLRYNPESHYLWNDNNNCQIYKVIGLKFNNA